MRSASVVTSRRPAVLQTAMAQVGLSTMTCGDASGIDRRLRCIPRMSHAPAIRLGSRTISLAPYPGQARRLTLIRPARKDEKQSRYFPNWLRQRVDAIIWTLKRQLGLERHGGRVPPSAGGPASCSACSPSTPAPGTTGSSAPRQALPDRLRPLSPDLTRFLA